MSFHEQDDVVLVLICLGVSLFLSPYNQISKLTPELFLWDGLVSNCSLRTTTPKRDEIHCFITYSFTIHEPDHKNQIQESLSLAGLTKMHEFLNKYFTLEICVYFSQAIKIRQLLLSMSLRYILKYFMSCFLYGIRFRLV